MRIADTNLLFALESGNKVRRNIWWQRGEDAYIKVDKEGRLYFWGETAKRLTLDDLWACDWEVC